MKRKIKTIDKRAEFYGKLIKLVGYESAKSKRRKAQKMNHKYLRA